MVAAPRIGVLITYHNEGPLLTRCLESLAAQTHPVDEILVYDDASEILPAEFVPPGLPVRLIRGDRNIGPGQGRNRLFEASTADLVHCHDADDAFAPEWSRRVRDVFADSEVDVLFSECAFVYADGRRVDDVVGIRRLVDGQDLVEFCIRGAMLTPTGTYRRAVVERVAGYRAGLWQSEDWDFHIRLALTRPRARYTCDPLVISHRRADSRSEHGREVSESTLQAIGLLADELPREYGAALADVAVQHASRLFRLGARRSAATGFGLARRLGRPTFADQNRMYRAVARLAGPQVAEWAAAAYRIARPAWLRRKPHSMSASTPA